MKSADIGKINRELLQKTGVDFSRYRDQELIDTVANAVTFPLFFARCVSRPVFVLVGFTVLAMLLAESSLFKAFLAVPGLPMAVLNGILLGLVVFVRRIKNDMTKVFSISSNLTLQVLKDISAARASLSANRSSLPSLLEVFQGVNAVVIMPMLIETLDRRIPVLGGMAAAITRRFFSLVNRRLTSAIKTKSDPRAQPTRLATPDEAAAWLDAAERVLNFVRDNSSRAVGRVSAVVAFPFATVFVLVMLLSLAVLFAARSWLG